MRKYFGTLSNRTFLANLSRSNQLFLSYLIHTSFLGDLTQHLPPLSAVVDVVDLGLPGPCVDRFRQTGSVREQRRDLIGQTVRGPHTTSALSPSLSLCRPRTQKHPPDRPQTQRPGQQRHMTCKNDPVHGAGNWLSETLWSLSTGSSGRGRCRALAEPWSRLLQRGSGPEIHFELETFV